MWSSGTGIAQRARSVTLRARYDLGYVSTSARPVAQISAHAIHSARPPFALEHIEHSINADRTYRENVLRATSQPDELCAAIVRPQIRKSEAGKVRMSNGLPCACCVPESPSVQCLDVLSAFGEETMDMHASRSRIALSAGKSPSGSRVGHSPVVSPFQQGFLFRRTGRTSAMTEVRPEASFFRLHMRRPRPAEDYYVVISGL
jgi:hypothetical protein